MCFSKLSKPELAIEDFTNVLCLNPDHVSAAFARAACYNTIGQFSKAIEDYNMALLKVFHPLPCDLNDYFNC